MFSKANALNDSFLVFFSFDQKHALEVLDTMKGGGGGVQKRRKVLQYIFL